MASLRVYVLRSALVSVMMAVMHKEVHQWARKEQKIWQYAKKMCAMFGEHEERGYCPEAEQSNSAARFPEQRIVVRRHLHTGLPGNCAVTCRLARFRWTACPSSSASCPCASPSSVADWGPPCRRTEIHGIHHRHPLLHGMYLFIHQLCLSSGVFAVIMRSRIACICLIWASASLKAFGSAVGDVPACDAAALWPCSSTAGEAPCEAPAPWVSDTRCHYRGERWEFSLVSHDFSLEGRLHTTNCTDVLSGAFDLTQKEQRRCEYPRSAEVAGDETARGERILVQVVEGWFAALRKCSSLSVLVYRK